MSKRDIGNEILKGIQEIKAYKAGQVELETRELTEPSMPQEIRKQLNLWLREWNYSNRGWRCLNGKK